MIKKILIALGVVFIFICGLWLYSYIENGKQTTTNNLIVGEYIQIGGNLYYNNKTSICYVLENHSVHVPYYAPNGNPYRYNNTTKELEMIP